jgi:hypothetical protein
MNNATRHTEEGKVCISGLMLRNQGHNLIVEIEVDGRWATVINEYCGPMEFAISHIVEGGGLVKRANSYPELDALLAEKFFGKKEGG